MAKCTYFFDKITNQIIGSHSHAERDQDGSIIPADSDIANVWENIRQGTMWPHLLEKVTGQDPANMDYLVTEDMPHGYNEYKPSKLESENRLERRPYFELTIADNHSAVMKSEERKTHRFYEIDTTGGVTLDMEVRVKTTQDTVEKHDVDRAVKGIGGEFLVECSAGRLVPRNGKITMTKSFATFQWHLPDTTAKELARCFVKDPKGEILISKSLRVNCY